MSGRQLAWVGATTFGLLAGGFVLHFPGSFAGQVGWSISAGVFGFMLGGLNGLGVGLLQRLALGKHPGSGFILWMALAVGGTHALFDASSTVSSIVVVAGLAGLVVAATYVVAIGDREIGRVAAIGVAWSVALVAADAMSNALGLPFEETPFGWASDHAFDGLVVGLGWGVATAATGLVERLGRRGPLGAGGDVLTESA